MSATDRPATPATPAPRIRSATSRAVEVAWFSALCSEDYEFLGVPEAKIAVIQNATAHSWRFLAPRQFLQLRRDLADIVTAARRSRQQG